MDKKILLTFDLEEFDLPLEYGCHISPVDQINITKKGLQTLTAILSKYDASATFFTTSFFAENNRELVKSLALNHEIASHSKNHSAFRETDPSDSKTELERITGKQVNGFRMPLFRKIDKSLIKDAGYKYDSSINPTYIPGRYNNLFTQRKIYVDKESNLIEVPVSVSPLLRFPLFWLSFKNMHFPFYYRICKMVLWKDSYLHLYFHPWEFVDLEPLDIPGYIKNLSGERFSERFEKLIVELGQSGDFLTISAFLDLREQLKI